MNAGSVPAVNPVLTTCVIWSDTRVLTEAVKLSSSSFNCEAASSNSYCNSDVRVLVWPAAYLQALDGG